MKKVKSYHKKWLKAIEQAIYFNVSFDSVGINAKRIDILFDMGLVSYRDAIYFITEKGRNLISA